MKKIVALLLTITCLLFAQAPQVTNVRYEQRTDGSLLVDVYYDVNDINKMNISLNASDDGGDTWDLNCGSVSGDVGSGITQGTDKHIVWDFHADNPGLTGSRFKVRVIAQDYLFTGTVQDIDGNIYQTVKIGDQWWMAENLRVTHYRNGDPIPNVTDNDEWNGLTSGAYCYYENDPENNDDYGALYNWYALTDSRNIAPDGWHAPTGPEWQTLLDLLGGHYFAGKKLKAESGWESNGNGTNESGFTALPGGCRYYTSGTFDSMGYRAYYWTATEYDQDNAWFKILNYDMIRVWNYHNDKKEGHSIRLVKDD